MMMSRYLKFHVFRDNRSITYFDVEHHIMQGVLELFDKCNYFCHFHYFYCTLRYNNNVFKILFFILRTRIWRFKFLNYGLEKFKPDIFEIRLSENVGGKIASVHYVIYLLWFVITNENFPIAIN